MRLLVMLCIAVSVVCAGYWVIVAQLITRLAPDAVAQNRMLAADLQQVQGFPFAFRTTLENLTLRADDHLFVWQVPSVALQALSYQPNQVSATFSGGQTFDYLDLQVALAHDKMQADLAADHLLRITTATASATAIAVTPSMLIESLDSLQASVTQLKAERYSFSWTAAGLRLSPDMRLALDPMSNLPEQIAQFEFTADVTLDGPLALNRPMPNPHIITLRDLILDWGDFLLSADGQLRQSATGGYDGTLSIELEDWRVLHALLVDTGMIEPDAARMAGFFLGSQAQPGGTTLDLTLNVVDSIVAFGPFTLGRLPGF
jgi:hypothetical protein